MNEHLPECPTDWCICSYLRACEERVLLAAEKRHEGELADEWQHGVTAGKVIGRMDAREAVAALTAGRERMDYEDGPEVYGAHNAYIDCVHDALATIDALREEKK